MTTDPQITKMRRLSGPLWAGEVLERLHARHGSDYSSKMAGCWDDLPVMTSLRNHPRWHGRKSQPFRVHLSSGTSGQPKLIHFSERDWREMVACRADNLAALGMDRTSRVVVAVPFSPWFSGDNLCEALTGLGAMVYAAGAYRPHLSSALTILHETASDTLITLPSTARTLVHMLNEGRDLGVLPQRNHLERVILVGESADNETRATIEKALGVTTHMLFAASEAVIGQEDTGRHGCYRWNRCWIHLEVLRDDGVIDDQGEGELLVSRRWSEATPVVRYALGDRVIIYPATDDHSEYFVHLHRQGQACRLPAGVTIDFPLLDRFLEGLRPAITCLDLHAHHHTDGHTNLTLTVNRIPEGQSLDGLANNFVSLSIDVADVIASGFVSLRVNLDSNLGISRGKSIQVRETGSW